MESEPFYFSNINSSKEVFATKRYWSKNVVIPRNTLSFWVDAAKRLDKDVWHFVESLEIVVDRRKNAIDLADNRVRYLTKIFAERGLKVVNGLQKTAAGIWERPFCESCHKNCEEKCHCGIKWNCRMSDPKTIAKSSVVRCLGDVQFLDKALKNGWGTVIKSLNETKIWLLRLWIASDRSRKSERWRAFFRDCDNLDTSGGADLGADAKNAVYVWLSNCRSECYVGETVQALNDRFATHISDIKNEDKPCFSKNTCGGLVSGITGWCQSSALKRAAKTG